MLSISDCERAQNIQSSTDTTQITVLDMNMNGSILLTKIYIYIPNHLETFHNLKILTNILMVHYDAPF